MPDYVIRGINANQLAGKSATTLGWFDFEIPNGYNGGAGIQLLIDCQVKRSPQCSIDGTFTFITAFAAQAASNAFARGGSIFFPPLGTALGADVPASLAESYAPGSALFMYCQNVDSASAAFNYNLPKYPMTEQRQVINIPIVGRSQDNWNSASTPLLANVGGGVCIDGSSPGVPGGIAGIGYFRVAAGGYIGVQSWAGGIAQNGAVLPSSSLTNASGLAAGANSYSVGEVISIGIYALCAGDNPSGDLHTQINAVSVMAGNIIYPLELTDMKVGWGTKNYHPIDLSQQKIIDTTPSTARAPNFWLEAITPPATVTPPIAPTLIALPPPAYVFGPAIRGQ